MTLDMEKVNIAMIRNQYSVTDLAKVYGVSRARMNTILNSRNVTAVCAGCWQTGVSGKTVFSEIGAFVIITRVLPVLASL